MKHWIEPASVFIIAIYVTMRVRQSGFGFIRWYGWLAVLAFAAEDSVIRAYDYYGYAPQWTHFIDRVPLLVALIWPVVIDSSRELAIALLGPDERRAARLKLALLTGFIVLLDASLIEPVSVRAGLWQWTHPGPFAVPWIGVIGWAYFAAWVTWLGPDSKWQTLSIPLVHVTLLVTYYAFFQFVPAIAGESALCVAAWIILGALAWWTFRAHAIERLELRTVMLRAPGALFFFALLGATETAPVTMWVYAFAFALPYGVYFWRWAQWASRPKNIMVTHASVQTERLLSTSERFESGV